MDQAIDQETMGDLAGWSSAIHAELGDGRLPVGMVLARWRGRLDPAASLRSGRNLELRRIPKALPVVPAISVPMVLLGLVIRQRLPLV